MKRNTELKLRKLVERIIREEEKTGKQYLVDVINLTEHIIDVLSEKPEHIWSFQEIGIPIDDRQFTIGNQIVKGMSIKNTDVEDLRGFIHTWLYRNLKNNPQLSNEIMDIKR